MGTGMPVCTASSDCKTDRKTGWMGRTLPRSGGEINGAIVGAVIMRLPSHRLWPTGAWGYCDEHRLVGGCALDRRGAYPGRRT